MPARGSILHHDANQRRLDNVRAMKQDFGNGRQLTRILIQLLLTHKARLIERINFYDAAYAFASNVKCIAYDLVACYAFNPSKR